MKRLIPYLTNEASQLFLKKWSDSKITCVYCGSSNIIHKGSYQKYFIDISIKNAVKNKGNM